MKRCYLVGFGFLLGIGSVLAEPIKVVNLTAFSGVEQYMQFKGSDTCTYIAIIDTNTKQLTVLGVSKPIKAWQFVVQQKICGDFVEKVNLIAIPEQSIKTMPIDAGSPFSLQSFVNSSLKTPE